MSKDEMPPINMNWPDQVTAHDVMRTVFEHYQSHYQIILKKLAHAQKATELSLEKTREAIEKAAQGTDARDIRSIEDFNQAWADVIALFERCGLSQEELFQIDGVLGTLPRTIKTHYDVLVQMDVMLQEMMEKLAKLNYADAIAKVDAVQDRPNPLSGLSRKEYEPEEHLKIKVFSFTPNKR